MKPFVACLTVAAVISFAVDAQALSPEQCQILATSIGDAGPSMQRMSGAVESLPLLSTLNLDLSTVKAEALALDRARDPLLRALQAYTTALQQFGFKLQRCAR